MSRWNREFNPSQPKQPPPRHGIKIPKKSGTTWWGKRWIEALERMSVGYSNRLARGRTYARTGRTHDLHLDSGKVTASVTGSRARPYAVALHLANLNDAIWNYAIHAMAEKAQFAAELLAGRMPKQIEEAFQGSGASLFPTTEADLVTECSCPDWANPCKHVAAIHYVLAESLDRDPFLLFELRGRTKQQVLRALRLARAAGTTPRSDDSDEGRLANEAREIAIPSVTLGELEPSSYDRPREAMEALRLSFDEPSVGAAILRQLGAPAGWKQRETPAELLAPRIRAAAARARGIALGDAQVETGAEAESTGETLRIETPPLPSAPPRGASARKSGVKKGAARQ